MAQKDKPPSSGGQAFGAGQPGMTYRQWLVGQILASGSLTGYNDDIKASKAVSIADKCIQRLGLNREALAQTNL